jgi:hypothetical protein
MIDKEFCEFIESKLEEAFANSNNKKIKDFLCDGILLPTFEKDYSKKFVNDNRTVVLTAFTGLSGQEKYELTLKFGDKAVSRYARDLNISECLINSENTKSVGESTDQDIWQRLTGHEKLQDILTLEKPFHHESINAHEIILLLFDIAGTESITIIDSIDNMDAFMEDLINPSLPSKKKITLDVEKALIKLLSPKRYNIIQYQQYPKSKDGLYEDNFDFVSYKIFDDITLKYSNAEIIGNPNSLKATSIIIEGNKILRLG